MKYSGEPRLRSDLIAQAAMFLHRAGYDIETIESMLPVTYENIYGRDCVGKKIVMSYYFLYREEKCDPDLA